MPAKGQQKKLKLTPAEIFEMSRSKTHTYKEIAKIAGCSVSHVHSVKSRYAVREGLVSNDQLERERQVQARGQAMIDLQLARSRHDILIGNPPAGLSALDKKIAQEAAAGPVYDPLDTSVPPELAFALKVKPTAHLNGLSKGED